MTDNFDIDPRHVSNEIAATLNLGDRVSVRDEVGNISQGVLAIRDDVIAVVYAPFMCEACNENEADGEIGDDGVRLCPGCVMNGHAAIVALTVIGEAIEDGETSIGRAVAIMRRYDAYMRRTNPGMAYVDSHASAWDDIRGEGDEGVARVADVACQLVNLRVGNS